MVYFYKQCLKIDLLLFSENKNSLNLKVKTEL